jgi:two-component system, OmpR family, sensor histidine kinase KdpD
MDIGWAATKADRNLAARWAFWLGMLLVASTVMLWVRGEIDQSHVSLTLLLVVLGGSAGGGRPLGFTLAVLGFVIIDYYFQPPFGLISVDKPLDWVVLGAFLAAAFVATELLTRAREESAAARQRGDEIESLSLIGSQTLRFARPEDALLAITNLVQATLRSRRTAIWLFDERDALGADAVAASGTEAVEGEAKRLELVALDRVDERAAHAAAELPDGSVLRGPLDAVGEDDSIVSLIVPLVVESRRLGLMYIALHGEPREIDGPTRRFLSALGYYAALGAERLRLAKEAEHARAMREESRAKDEVLATVSHDLRTPLTTIKLLAQRATARGEASGESIEAEVDRLADLVTNVLDLSRIRAGGVQLDVELNTAEDLVGAAMRRAMGIAQDRTIIPHLDFDSPALTGQFDFVQSLRIVGNLIDNALRYTRPGGAVDVYATREESWLAIRVADRGPGIPPAERERIFEPFYRPRSESPDVGHAGLGLSIARRLAELQGGRLAYMPRFGGGSVFELLLPAADAADPASIGDPRVYEVQPSSTTGLASSSA